MSTEWNLMKEIVHASNNGKQDKIAKIITTNCFMGMERAVTMAVSAFSITEENIKLHSDAAIKLAKLKQPEPWREACRHGFLIERLTELGLVT